jgi:DNA-nicking Smr family endonuclease
MNLGGEDEEGGDPGSFAELIGETKPISPGPARVERATPRSKISRPRASPESRTPASTFRWPDKEEPRLAAAPGVSDAQIFALGRGEPEPEEKIDLHGLRRDSVGRLLADRIASARARGLRCLVVIHGRGQRSGTGEAVLRDAIPGWLTKPACAKHLLGFAPAPNRHGGEGAMLVLLRKR